MLKTKHNQGSGYQEVQESSQNQRRLVKSKGQGNSFFLKGQWTITFVYSENIFLKIHSFWECLEKASQCTSREIHRKAFPKRSTPLEHRRFPSPTKTVTKAGRGTEIMHPLVHSLNGYISQNWVRLKPRVWNSTRISYLGGRSLKHLAVFLNYCRCIIRVLDGKWSSSSTYIGCFHQTWWLNPLCCNASPHCSYQARAILWDCAWKSLGIYFTVLTFLFVS